MRNHRKKSVMLLLLLALVLGSVLGVRADENWSEDYYRAVDLTQNLSEAQRNDLDSGCIEFMKTYHLDCCLLAVPTERYADSSMEELAGGMFTENGFGYGEGKDGFSIVYDAENGAEVILCMGRAQGVIDERYLDFIIKTVPKYQEEYGTYGPLYASLRMLSREMEKLTEEGSYRIEGESEIAPGEGAPEEPAVMEDPSGEDISEEKTPGEDAAGEDAPDEEGQKQMISSDADLTRIDHQMAEQIREVSEALQNPAEKEAVGEDAQTEPNLDAILTGQELYDYIERMPKADLTRGQTDPKTGADETRSRVVDRADLLTDQEENRLEEHLYEIRKEIGTDLVVLTDTSCYGKERSVYAADFFDYNGYGCGARYEGACLLICMDPNDRGFWTCCTGSHTKNAYSYAKADMMDDMLYEFAKQSRFSEGISDWAENFRRLIKYGHPFCYDWMKGNLPEEFIDPKAPRIVDDGHLLWPDEADQLKRTARELSDIHGTDIVIHTCYNTAELALPDYEERFWRACGYGKGDDRRGILITVEKKSGYTAHVYVRCFGDAKAFERGVGISRLQSRTETMISDLGASEGLKACLKMMDSLIRKGRVPRSTLSWALSIALDLVLALIFGGILLGRAKKRMDTPKVEENAEPYLVPGTLSIQNLKDTYIKSSVTRTRKPSESSSTRSSSSSRSSYSSSYSGSSGRSHSGSGRSF